MPIIPSFIRGAVLIVLMVSVSACATTVHHVTVDPSRYRNKTVTVSGRVTDSVSFAGRGAYRLTDRTGSLWVVSRAGVPRPGARVTVKGRVHDVFSADLFGGHVRLPPGLDAGVVMTERSHRTR